MENTGTIRLGDENFEFPMIEGTEGEKALDTRTLRAKSGCITFDEGYGNTGSCMSKITFIDGENGILRHRGYPIEQLAEHSSFLETAMLVIYGSLPHKSCLHAFRQEVRKNASIHTGMHSHFDGFPSNAHPMAILSSMLNSLGAYYPEMSSNDREQDLAYFDETAALLISKVRTIAAMTYRMKMGLPFVHPADKRYTGNFLHMMFSEPYFEYHDDHGAGKALDLFLTLHADHEQNCSTSTVRMVASGGANLFASVSAGVCALWGPSHGGANMAVIKMLDEIHAAGDDGSKFIEAAKKGEAKLMGFGHRVYKSYDPRAKVMRETCHKVLTAVDAHNEPLFKLAMELERIALEDPYFIEKKLYPNVDFYSGITLSAIGIPTNMFTVIFALARTVGWMSHWMEMTASKSKIGRPRQLYTGEKQRDVV